MLGVALLGHGWEHGWVKKVTVTRVGGDGGQQGSLNNYMNNYKWHATIVVCTSEYMCYILQRISRLQGIESRSDRNSQGESHTE